MTKPSYCLYTMGVWHTPSVKQKIGARMLTDTRLCCALCLQEWLWAVHRRITREWTHGALRHVQQQPAGKQQRLCHSHHGSHRLCLIAPADLAGSSTHAFHRHCCFIFSFLFSMSCFCDLGLTPKICFYRRDSALDVRLGHYGLNLQLLHSSLQ